MKKSVNGKSFDEIFGQRGEKCGKKGMRKGRFYLLDQSGHFSWNWIIVFDRIVSGDFFASEDIDSNGYCYKPSLYLVAYSADVTSIHEATPDQIALLELYKPKP